MVSFPCMYSMGPTKQVYKSYNEAGAGQYVMVRRQGRLKEESS